MFGYVKIFKPELTDSEYDQYRGVYCSLCQALGKRYGFKARLTLSYDFTFLSVFLMALDARALHFEEGRCPFKPTKKCPFCIGEASGILDFSADVAVLLTYQKLNDTVKDERWFKKWGACIGKMLYRRYYKKAKRRRPYEASLAEDYISSQNRIEALSTVSLDQAAHPTALFLSKLAVAYIRQDDEDIERFGYCLGRFIYLADAAEDMDDDAKKGNFNPFLLSTSQEYIASQNVSIRQYATEVLHSSVAVCAECFERLKVYRFDRILRNVLYWGMPNTIQSLNSVRQKGDHNEKSV